MSKTLYSFCTLFFRMRFSRTLVSLCIFLMMMAVPAVAASDLTLSGPSSVIAGNSFVLLVSGGDLRGTVSLAMTSGDRPDLQLLPGQADVSGTAAGATVQLDANGRARVQYTTSSGGEESNCRFRVSDGSSSDTTTVKVTRGSVSATVAPTKRPVSQGDSYAIGSEVPLSGAAAGTSKVYLFVIGPNLPSAGAKLSSPSVAAVTGEPDTFVSRTVDSSGRWSYKWQTRSSLDAGTYTIFAVDRPANRYSLSDASYSTYTVTLGRPSISASASNNPGTVSSPPVTTPTATVTPVPTEVPTTLSTPEPSLAAELSRWDQFVAWVSGLFRVSAAEPVGYVLVNGEITLSGSTIFSTEKELLVSISPYFTAEPKGSVETFSGWSETVPVVSGESGNVWSVTAAVPAGAYILTIEPVGGGQMISREIAIVG